MHQPRFTFEAEAGDTDSPGAVTGSAGPGFERTGGEGSAFGPTVPSDVAAVPPAAAQQSADLVRQADGPETQASAGPMHPESVRQTIEPARPAVEFVRHPRAQRYLIRVRVDGSVRVTIPRRGSRREATEFYNRQQAWIVEQQQRVATLRDRLPEDLPENEQRQLRLRARRELPARLLELAEPLGLTVRRISVRNQRQRWGSCSPSGLICLNWRLITMPDWVRDYVLYHELMHLKRMDHSPAFWRLVAEVCPRYQEARRWLRRHALAPHAPAAHDEENATSQ